MCLFLHFTCTERRTTHQDRRGPVSLISCRCAKGSPPRSGVFPRVSAHRSSSELCRSPQRHRVAEQALSSSLIGVYQVLEPQLRDEVPCFSPAFFRAICEFLELLTPAERRAPQEDVARRHADEQKALKAGTARQHDVSLADATRPHRIGRGSSLGCLTRGSPPSTAQVAPTPSRCRAGALQLPKWGVASLRNPALR